MLSKIEVGKIYHDGFSRNNDFDLVIVTGIIDAIMNTQKVVEFTYLNMVDKQPGIMLLSTALVEWTEYSNDKENQI